MHDISIGSSSPHSPRNPKLSLILCSRNDQYMGNSRWRLQTTLNYVAQMVHELSREEDVEVVVADWGSDVPLREVLELSPAAARMVSFILIPPDIARDLQKDSPFPEVLALNAAARRAGGEYIGRIDQDILVGKRFLKWFFELYEGRQQLDVPLTSVLLFANQRMVPYRFSVSCPSLWAVDKYISCFGRFLKMGISSRAPFYCAGVGIWLVHRDLWNECGGYDEEMIYMNGMEVNMIVRLMKKYKMVNLGKLVDYDFYHIEHIHPWVPRWSRFNCIVNPCSENPPPFHPNDEDWGLIQYPLEVLSYLPPGGEVNTVALDASRFRWPVSILLLLSTGAQAGGDRLFLSLRAAWWPLWRFIRVCRHRPQVAWKTVRGQPFISWPRLLRERWRERWHY